MRWTILVLALMMVRVGMSVDDEQQRGGGEKPIRGVNRAAFGKTRDGRPVDLYILTNANGLEMRVMTYGGIITNLKATDRLGQMGDIVLGFDSLDGYLQA